PDTFAWSGGGGNGGRVTGSTVSGVGAHANVGEALLIRRTVAPAWAGDAQRRHGPVLTGDISPLDRVPWGATRPPMRIRQPLNSAAANTPGGFDDALAPCWRQRYASGSRPASRIESWTFARRGSLPDTDAGHRLDSHRSDGRAGHGSAARLRQVSR